MSQQPVIAIPQLGFDPFRLYMKGKYVQSLRRAGARVQWLPIRDLDRAAALLRGCDGLLMPGGADLAPSYYGQATRPECGTIKPERDAADWRLLQEWQGTGKPLLGVCKGVQVLNVFYGGTLFQDIKTSQRCPHSDFRHRGTGTHAVTLTQGTRLADILGVDALTVNSMHHQAVDTPGKGLRVSAVSEDGFVEALEDPSLPFCVAVQWHPEHLSRSDAREQALFNAFVNACRTHS